MANNFLFDSGGALTGASDDVAGVHYQRLKIVDGTEDSTTASKITTSAATTTDPGFVVRPIPFTGYTPYHLRSAATINATTLKASAGTVGLVTASNTNAAARWLKFYNKSASVPAPASDLALLVQSYLIPGNTSGTNIPIPARGLNFSTGIGFVIVTGETDTDATAVALGEVHINVAYA